MECNKVIDKDMIKALRCIASQNVEGNCYADIENYKHISDDNWKRIVCNEGECLWDFISGGEAVACPYYQKQYGTYAVDGELWWLKDLADKLDN